MTTTKQYLKKLVRIVTISQDGLRPSDKQKLIEGMLERMNQSAAFKPDIVCLPEIWTRREAEPVPGPTTELACSWAKEHDCYLICPMWVTVESMQYNSAVVIDRKGVVIGRYDKIHTTVTDTSTGTSPGQLDPPVFQTDFGPIGIQICFDINWRDGWRRLKEQGAKIIFWPSAYGARRHLAALAMQNEVYVVSATLVSASRIIDISGDTIAKTGRYQHWAGAVLPMGKRLLETDYQIDLIRRVQQKYGDRVSIEWVHDEDEFTLASLDPELTEDEIIREFGLLPTGEYHTRCTAVQDACRGKSSQELRSSVKRPDHPTEIDGTTHF
jgi:beta-ureidopropionase